MSSAVCASSMYSRLCMKLSSFLFVRACAKPRLVYLSCVTVRSHQKLESICRYLHLNYEQSTSHLRKRTSLLRECSSSLWEKDIPTTSEVHPYYEQGGRKMLIFDLRGLISFICIIFFQNCWGRYLSFPPIVYPLNYSFAAMFPFNPK